LRIVIPSQGHFRPPQIRGRRFTAVEDDRIIQYVTECGGHCTDVQWLALEEELGRQNLSSQLRWKNVLKPRLRNALAEQSGAILAGLSTGRGSPVSFDLPPKALIGTLQYKRHTFTALENERILGFAQERATRDPPTPWTHLDKELGRNSGSCKHRYDSLILKPVKETMKDMLDHIEKSILVSSSSEATPTMRRSRNQVLLEQRPQLSLVRDYTIEEDAIISSTVRASPGLHLTTTGWKMLSMRLGRPESWLRYRWAILAKQEGEMLKASSPVPRAPAETTTINTKTPSIISPTSTHSTSSFSLSSADESSFPPPAVRPPHVAPPTLPALPAPRTCTSNELTHIAVQMTKSQTVREDVWLYLSLQLSCPVSSVQQLWLERQQGGRTANHPFSPAEQAHIVRVIEDHLAAQKEQAWLRLGQDLRLIPAQVQAIWSQLWFALYLPHLYPAGFATQAPPSSFFSEFDNTVIARRMRSCSLDCSIPAWLPDLATFLSKPVVWVAVQWEVLRQQLDDECAPGDSPQVE